MHALAAELKITHGDLRSFAFEQSNGRTDHTSELTFDEAAQIIATLEKHAYQMRTIRGEHATPKKQTPSRRTVQLRRQKAGIKSVPTAKQLKYIADLREMRQMTDAGWDSFANHTIGKTAPLTSKEAGKLIEGLKALNARTMAESEAV